jgi:hypothetical protein
VEGKGKEDSRLEKDQNQMMEKVPAISDGVGNAGEGMCQNRGDGSDGKEDAGSK